MSETAQTVSPRPEVRTSHTLTFDETEMELLRISAHHELNRTRKNVERLKVKLTDYAPGATQDRIDRLEALIAKLPRR